MLDEKATLDKLDSMSIEEETEINGKKLKRIGHNIWKIDGIGIFRQFQMFDQLNRDFSKSTQFYELHVEFENDEYPDESHSVIFRDESDELAKQAVEKCIGGIAYSYKMNWRMYRLRRVEVPYTPDGLNMVRGGGEIACVVNPEVEE